MRKKIFIGIFLLVGLITLALFVVYLLQTSGVYQQYECTVYTEETTGDPVNLLPNYSYYRLELKLNRTFVMTSLIKGQEEASTATGTFTKSRQTITLTYAKGQNPVEAVIFPSEVFVYRNGTLNRNQSGSFSGTSFQTTVVQEFVKKR